MSRVQSQNEEGLPPGLGIRLLEAPVDRRDDPRASVYIVDHVNGGETITRRFLVANGTEREQQISLYAAAATIRDGTFLIGAGRATSELTEWMTIEPETLTLPAGETADASVTIEVPDDAPSGEFYAAAVAEIPATGGPGISVASRVGVRVYLSVGTGAEPETDFELPAFRPVRQPDGRPAVEIDGCNTGGRAVDLTGDIELTNGPGGIKAGPFPTPNATTLAPEQCHTFAIPLDPELPNGPWDATARLRSGEEERTAQARITFPEEAGERGEKVETREVTGTLPGIIATGISILLLLLLGGWLFWFLFKRRARRKDDEEEERR